MASGEAPVRFKQSGEVVTKRGEFPTLPDAIIAVSHTYLNHIADGRNLLYASKSYVELMTGLFPKFTIADHEKPKFTEGILKEAEEVDRQLEERGLSSKRFAEAKLLKTILTHRIGKRTSEFQDLLIRFAELSCDWIDYIALLNESNDQRKTPEILFFEEAIEKARFEKAQEILVGTKRKLGKLTAYELTRIMEATINLISIDKIKSAPNKQLAAKFYGYLFGLTGDKTIEKLLKPEEVDIVKSRSLRLVANNDTKKKRLSEREDREAVAETLDYLSGLVDGIKITQIP